MKQEINLASAPQLQCIQT